jgi:hypothetical protein
VTEGLLVLGEDPRCEPKRLVKPRGTASSSTRCRGEKGGGSELASPVNFIAVANRSPFHAGIPFEVGMRCSRNCLRQKMNKEVQKREKVLIKQIKDVINKRLAINLKT